MVLLLYAIIFSLVAYIPYRPSFSGFGTAIPTSFSILMKVFLHLLLHAFANFEVGRSKKKEKREEEEEE